MALAGGYRGVVESLGFKTQATMRTDTEAPFSEKEVALEKAIAGSGSAECCEVIYFPDLCTIQYIPVYREYYGEYICI